MTAKPRHPQDQSLWDADPMDTEHAEQNFAAGFDAWRPEKHPRHVDGDESDSYRGQRPQLRACWSIAEPAMPKMIDRQEQPMERSPDREIPSCSMPKAAQKHRDHEICVATSWPVSVAA